MSVLGLNLKLLKKAIVCRRAWWGSPDLVGVALPVIETSGINRWVRTRVPRVLGRLRTAVRTVNSTLKIKAW